MCIPENVFDKVGSVERKATGDERKRVRFQVTERASRLGEKVYLSNRIRDETSIFLSSRPWSLLGIL